MTGSGRDLLFDLLPQFVRGADAGQPSQPLRTLYRVLQSAYDHVESDISGLYDDWFIETCAERVVPRIAAALGTDLAGTPVWSHRAQVANSLGWQSRPGTLATLAQAAASASGWPAVACDLGAEVATSAVIGPAPGPAAVVRIPPKGSVTERAGARRSVAVSPAPPARGRRLGIAYAVPGAVSLRVYTMPVFAVENAAPGRRDGLFTFDTAGRGGPLFIAPDVFAPSVAEPAPHELPQPLTRPLLRDMLAAPRPRLPFAIRRRTRDGWIAVRPQEIVVARLDAAPHHGGAPDRVLVDPERGLFGFGEDVPDLADLRVDYAFGFGGPVGASAWSADEPVRAGPGARRIAVASRRGSSPERERGGSAASWPSLGDVLTAWEGTTDLDLLIADGGRHAVPDRVPRLGPGVVLTISAADGARPLLEGTLEIEGEDGSGLVLQGLQVPDGVRLRGPSLVLRGSTVGLARPEAVRLDGDWRSGRLHVARSIVGPVRCEAARLTADRSIFDGRPSPGGAPGAAIRGLHGAVAAAVDLDRCTVLGDLHLARAAALTECAIDGRVHEPDGTLRLRADFVTTRLGDPGYLQGAPEDRDGASRGAFGDGDRARRLQALDAAIARHLPQGLACAVVLGS